MKGTSEDQTLSPLPEISVAVTNWNGRDHLMSCMEAIRRQTHPIAEVLLVDNASTDDSVEWMQQNHPDVRIIQMNSNEGPGPARNAGFREARSPWVFSIDNDAEPAPDCLEILAAQIGSGAICIHPRSVFSGETDRVHYDGAGFHYVGMLTLHNFYVPLSDASTEAKDIDGMIAVALLFDREAVIECGGYDPRYFILFEDHDLSYRIRSRGLTIRHEPSAIVLHREGTKGISFRRSGDYSGRRVFLHSRNRWFLLMKCHSLRALILGAPGILIYDLAYLFFAIRERAFLAWCRGKFEALQGCRGVLRERRQVQRSRTVRDRHLLQAHALTISPLIQKKGIVGGCFRMMDALLRGYWKLVRWMT
jgi:hypothetical protein